MKGINVYWWCNSLTFWRTKGKSIWVCLGLLFLALTFTTPNVYGQNLPSGTKSKKVPKVKKVKPRNTKKSKSGKVKRVNPRSASGRKNHTNQSVTPSYTKKKSTPAVKKVNPRSISGRKNYIDRNVVPGYTRRKPVPKVKKVVPNSASGKVSYKNRRVSPRSASGSVSFKNTRVSPRSISGKRGFKDRRVIPSSASGSVAFKNKSVAPRSATGHLKFKDKGVFPRYSQRAKGSDNTRVQVRNTRGRSKYNVVTVTPRSIRTNRRYGSSRNKNRLLTYPSNVASLHKGNIKRKGRRKPGNYGRKSPASLQGAGKYNLAKVSARSISSNPRIRSTRKKGKLMVLPKNTGALFSGNIRRRGKGPAANDGKVKPRYSAHGQKKYKKVLVTPRSINSNPKFRANSNQNKLLTYPKDVSALYVGNIKSRKGHKHRLNKNKYISYSGNIKMREPKRREVGTQYSGSLKRKGPNYQRLDKSDYIKGRSKAQWASYYRQKTKKQAAFIGFQKYRPKKEKWMHPSAGYKVGRYQRTVEARERIRKRKLWWSRKKKNDDQPKYLKMKEKKSKYDPKEIKIWSDYDNSRGRAEGKKVKKNDN